MSEQDTTSDLMLLKKLQTLSEQNSLKGKGKYLAAKITHQTEQVILIKPMTYMNLSGHAVVAAMNFYKIGRNDILVMCDDLNLPSGSIRLRAKGSAGGQNGLKHIIESLGSEEFARMRIGIRPDDQPLHSFSSFVLGNSAKKKKRPWRKYSPSAVMRLLISRSTVSNMP